MALVALSASFVLVASALAAAPVSYRFDGLALYQFFGPPSATFNFGPSGNPDTGFVVITNNGTSTFSGTIGFNAIGGSGTNATRAGCTPAFDWSSSFPGVTLAPGESASVSINDESSNFCGYNGPFKVLTTPQLGAEFFMTGTVTDGVNTTPVHLSIFDKDIHSGVFAMNPFGVKLDNYILQGGDPYGRDTGDDFEVAQAPGPFLFQPCPNPFYFNFAFGLSQYPTCFRDLLRGGEINVGPDVGNTGNSALNFTGPVPQIGSTHTWLTLYDTDPQTSAPDSTFGPGPQTLCADVLIERFNNAKGAGVVALFNEGPGLKGLALYIIDSGNADKLFLSTIAQNGTLTPLTPSVPLGSGISEKAWYRVMMTVNPATPLVTGKVFSHTTATNPNSLLSAQVGSTLTYSGVLPAASGENGIMATDTSAVVNSSVTNFTNIINTNILSPTACF
jgi:hypothetical protein